MNIFFLRFRVSLVLFSFLLFLFRWVTFESSRSRGRPPCSGWRRPCRSGTGCLPWPATKIKKNEQNGQLIDLLTFFSFFFFRNSCLSVFLNIQLMAPKIPTLFWARLLKFRQLKIHSFLSKLAFWRTKINFSKKVYKI